MARFLVLGLVVAAVSALTVGSARADWTYTQVISGTGTALDGRSMDVTVYDLGGSAGYEATGYYTYSSPSWSSVDSSDEYVLNFDSYSGGDFGPPLQFLQVQQAPNGSGDPVFVVDQRDSVPATFNPGQPVQFGGVLGPFSVPEPTSLPPILAAASLWVCRLRPVRSLRV